MIDTVALLEGWAAALWRASWQGGLAALAVWFVGWVAPSLPARFTFQKQYPLSYATLLVSVISKLGPRQMIPALSVGVEGSQQSLRQRVTVHAILRWHSHWRVDGGRFNWELAAVLAAGCR